VSCGFHAAAKPAAGSPGAAVIRSSSHGQKTRSGRSPIMARHAACLSFRAPTPDDHSGNNVPRAPATWSGGGKGVPCLSITFDGCKYGFVAAIPSLRSANTDFPLQTPGSPAHLYKWVHNSVDARVTRARMGKEQAYETPFGGIVASKTEEAAALCR